MGIVNVHRSMISVDEHDETQLLHYFMEEAPSFPPPSSRISFTLHRNRPYQNKFNTGMNCQNQVDQVVRAPLPSNMTVDSPGVLDFTTYWSTDLKILVMGDSVALQMSETLEEVVEANASQRSILRENWKGHAGLHVSAPVRGGGVVAGWRILHFLLAQNEGKPLPNRCCGGWRRQDLHQLLNYKTKSSTSSTIESFDVMVFRIAHGWHNLDEVTRPYMEETIRMAHSLFGVKTIIFLSLPFVNNILNQTDLDLLHAKRELVQEVAHNWTMEQQLKRQRNNTVEGVETVLVLDMAKLTDELITWNAELLGMDTRTSDYWLESLGTRVKAIPYLHHTAQVCASRPYDSHNRSSTNQKRQPAKKGCTFNSFSRDGMHWCFETIGGRLFAGLACQLACVYPTYNHSSSTNTVEPQSPTILSRNGSFRDTPWSSVEDCAQKCNDKYMGLRPIDRSEILD